MKVRPILLVEDNSDDEMLTTTALKKLNIINDIIVARDGVEALDYLFARGKYSGRNIHNQPQVVLLDLKLPKVDGLEVLKEMRKSEELKRIPVVMLTSSNEESDLVKSYDLGANGYVTKPVGLDDFMKAVKEVGVYWLLLNQPAP